MPENQSSKTLRSAISRDLGRDPALKITTYQNIHIVYSGVMTAHKGNPMNLSGLWRQLGGRAAEERHLDPCHGSWAGKGRKRLLFETGDGKYEPSELPAAKQFNQSSSFASCFPQSYYPQRFSFVHDGTNRAKIRIQLQKFWITRKDLD